MDILIRRATVIDPSSPFHQQATDILIQNGFITAIGTTGKDADVTIDIPGLFVSPGWVDIFSHFCDPGLEFRETVETGALAAAHGGFTDVFVLPNTQPVVHSKGSVEYLVNKGLQLPVNIYPIAAITKNTEGKELAEMYDMQYSGAVCFSDGIHCVQSSGILVKALQYVKAIDKVIIQLPEDKAITGTGLMNEGIISTRMGLAGKPAIAEELMIARDIELAKYTESRIHFTGISTAKSVQIIRKAKNEGIGVTCSVTPHHLFFIDEDLQQYDTNLKVNPPLRTAADRQALREGLEDGTIDCIATHHLPQHFDHKVTEFEYAKDGMIGLETSFGAIKTALPDISMEKLVEVLSTNARKIFDLPQTTIDVNQPATLSLFNPEESWTVENLHSKSKNSPFLGKELTGRPVGIINKEKLILNEEYR
jgi:dihydroorotase